MKKNDIRNNILIEGYLQQSGALGVPFFFFHYWSLIPCIVIGVMNKLGNMKYIYIAIIYGI